MIKNLFFVSAVLLSVTNYAYAEDVFNGDMSIKYSATLSQITKAGTVKDAETWDHTNVSINNCYFSFSSNALVIKKTTQHTYSAQYETYSLTPVTCEDSYIVLDDDWTEIYGSSNNYTLPASYEESLSYDDLFHEDGDELVFNSEEVQNKYYEIIERYKTKNFFRSGRGSGDSYGLLKGDEVKSMFKITSDSEGFNIQNNLYYAITFGNTVSAPTNFSCYSVNSVDASEVESFDYNDYRKTYKVTTIPSSFIKSTTQSLTISKSVNTIADDAFVNARQLNEIIINKNGNYKVVDGCLFAFDNVNFTYTLLFVMPSNSNTTINLDEDVVAMSPNALACVRRVTIKSTVLSSYSDANNNVVINTSPAQCIELTNPAGVTYYKVTGMVTNSDLATIIETSNNAKYVDFSEASIAESLDLSGYYSNEYNTLYIFGELASGITVTGDNVIINGTCANFVITESAQAFYSPIEFTAVNATYVRGKNYSTNWSTICLPFSVPGSKIAGSDTFGNTFKYGTLSNYEASSNIFNFEMTGDLTAYQPLIIKSRSGEIAFPTLNNVTVAATPANLTVGEENGIASFTGVMMNTTLPKIQGGEAVYNYGFSNNKIGPLSGTSVKAFRAYLTAPSENYNNAGALRVVDADGTELDYIEFDNTTDLEFITVSDNKDIIYNISGQKVVNASETGVYLKNGNKMIVK